jgi:hypothetical protein
VVRAGRAVPAEYAVFVIHAIDRSELRKATAGRRTARALRAFIPLLATAGAAVLILTSSRNNDRVNQVVGFSGLGWSVLSGLVIAYAFVRTQRLSKRMPVARAEAERVLSERTAARA